MMEFGGQWNDALKGLKKKTVYLEFCTQPKNNQNEGEIKMFSDRQMLSELSPADLTKY